MPRSASSPSLSIIQGTKKLRNHQPVCVCVFYPQSATQKSLRTTTPPVQTPALPLCEGIPRSAKRVYQDLGRTPSSKLFLPPHCLFMLRRPPAVYRIHSVVSSSFASHGTSDRSRIRESFAHALCARSSYTWPSCVLLHSSWCAIAQLTRCTVFVRRRQCRFPVPASLQGHLL
jgi:hypothetical protein